MTADTQDTNPFLKYWTSVINTGVQADDSPEVVERYTRLNRIAVYQFLIGAFSLLLVMIFLKETHITIRTILFALVGPFVILLAHFRLLLPARIVLCYLPSFIYFILPILAKNIIFGNFFWFPGGLLFASFVPILIFDVKKEKAWIIAIMASLGVCALFIDKWMVMGLRESIDLTVIRDNYYFYKVPQIVLWLAISILLFRQVAISSRLAEESKNISNLLEAKNRRINDQSMELKNRFDELRETQQQLIEEKEQLNKLNSKLRANEEVLRKAYLKLKDNREEIESQNNLIIQQNQELLVRQKEISDLNVNLEKLVGKRTRELEMKNKALVEYAHFNSHQVRSPLTKIMGILYLLKIQDFNKEGEVNNLIAKLDDSVNELDEVIREMNDLFEKENK